MVLSAAVIIAPLPTLVISLNFVLSATVIIAPLPALVTPDKSVTNEVVYIPLVTVPAFPSRFPSIFAFIVPTEPENTLPLSIASGIYVNF